MRQSGSGSMQVAPVTGNNRGLARAEIKQGIREVVMCKDGTGKVGLRVRHVNNVSGWMLAVAPSAVSLMEASFLITYLHEDLLM